MGYVKKKTCSSKHDEKKSWTHEGPIIQKRERVGHMKFHVFKKERERQPMSKEKGIKERDGS